MYSKANKFETTLEEVLENTNEIELAQFIIDFKQHYTMLMIIKQKMQNKSEGKSDQ